MRPAAEPLRLHIERVMPGSPADAFRAQTDPALLARWWGPSGFTCPEVALEPRAAGRLRITMQPPEGEAFHLAGEFLEFAPPSRLVYTFRWEEPHPDDRETVVAVRLDPIGGATAMSVDQGDFATAERLALHVAGWSEALERLAGTLRGQAGRGAGKP